MNQSALTRMYWLRIFLLSLVILLGQFKEECTAEKLSPTSQSTPLELPSPGYDESKIGPEHQLARRKASQLWNAARDLEQNGDLAGALKNYRLAATAYSTVPTCECYVGHCLKNAASIFLNIGKLKEGIAESERALDTYKKIKGKIGARLRGDCEYNIGAAYFELRVRSDALSHLGKALQLWEESNADRDRIQACRVLLEHTRALPDGPTVYVAREDIPDFLVEEAKQLSKAASGKYCDGDFLGAAMLYRKAAKLAEAAGDFLQKAEYLQQSGDAWHEAMYHNRALEDLGIAVQVFSELPKYAKSQAYCMMLQGIVLSDLGQRVESEEKFQQAIALLQKIKNTKIQLAGCWLNRGNNFRGWGRYEEALFALTNAYHLFLELQQKDDIGFAAEAIGNTFVALSMYEYSMQWYNRALTYFRESGSKKNIINLEHNLGVNYYYMGKYNQAIRHFRTALNLGQQKSIKPSEMTKTRESLAIALSSVGEDEMSLKIMREAVDEYAVLPNASITMPLAQAKLAKLQVAAGHNKEAIENITAFVTWANSRQALVPWWIADAGASAANRLSPREWREFALLSHKAAIDSIEKMRTGMLGFESRVSWFEDKASAYKSLCSRLLIASKDGIIPRQPWVEKWGEGKLSAVYCKAAFHYADRGKGRALQDALRDKIALKAARPDTKLLVEDKELSLRISKLTSLREQLSEAEAERRKKLTQNIEELQQQRNMIEVKIKCTTLGGYVAPKFRKPMDMAKDLNKDTAVLQYSVGEREGWLLILTRKGVTAHRLDFTVKALPELFPRQEATLEQLVKAWKKRPEKIGLDGLVRLARTRVEDLGHEVSKRHNLIDAEQERRILKRLGEAALPDLALTELRQKGVRQLLVIPDGSLHYIPFGMLRVTDSAGTSKQFLIEEFAISYTPAMTTLDTIRKQKQYRQKKRKLSRRPLLAFANPDFKQAVIHSTDDMVTRLRSFRSGYYSDKGLRLTVLPETEKEAVCVASLSAPVKLYSEPTLETPEGKAVVYTHQGASEAQVKRLLSPPKEGELKPQWQYLLFSTHGLADTHNGMLSCIVLSSPSAKSEEDGFLQAQEVMNLELDADLVMLSACQTGLGRMRGGEGLVGLSAAFFYAGSESVCASLWQVPTGPTGQLVTEFFKNLKAGKVNKAKALRQAQLKVMRQGRNPDGKTSDYSSPFCWAAFTLIGDWR